MSEENVGGEVTNGKVKRPPPVETKVTMRDGREVVFVGKRKMLKNQVEDGDSAGVRFDFVNGETRTVMLTPSDPLLMKFAAHGLSQKIGDESAGAESVDDMVMSTDDMIKRLAAGNWGAERGSGDSFAGAGIVVRALFEATNAQLAERGKPPTTIDAIKSYLEKRLEQGKESGLTRQKLYASFKAPGTKTAAIIQRLQDEKAAKDVAINGDEALDEMVAAAE